MPTANPHFIEATEHHILDHQDDIEFWLRQQFRATPAQLYVDGDRNDAGFRLSLVNANLFRPVSTIDIPLPSE